MSMNYWAIVGLGLKVEEEFFDWKKCLEFIKANFEVDMEKANGIQTEEDFHAFCDERDIYLDVFLEAIVNNYDNAHIGYMNGNLSDEGTFLLFFPSYPWSLKKEDLNITRDEAEEKVYECIRPYLKDELSKEEMMAKIDYVSTYGCG